MIATKQKYDIQGIELEANISAETVWATISLKDQRKLVVGSYYQPPDSGSDSIDDLESVLSFISYVKSFFASCLYEKVTMSFYRSYHPIHFAL